jgi:hypothetical protein
VSRKPCANYPLYLPVSFRKEVPHQVSEPPPNIVLQHVGISSECSDHKSEQRVEQYVSYNELQRILSDDGLKYSQVRSHPSSLLFAQRQIVYSTDRHCCRLFRTTTRTAEICSREQIERTPRRTPSVVVEYDHAYGTHGANVLPHIWWARKAIHN